jgi:hypothetical protein
VNTPAVISLVFLAIIGITPPCHGMGESPWRRIAGADCVILTRQSSAYAMNTPAVISLVFLAIIGFTVTS